MNRKIEKEIKGKETIRFKNHKELNGLDYYKKLKRKYGEKDKKNGNRTEQEKKQPT